MKTLLCCLVLCVSAAVAAPPDFIVHNAKVVTVDKQFRIAQAFAVKGGTIVAVGNNKDILALAGEKTRRIDLKGKTVLPGLIDSHVHPTGAAMFEFDHAIPRMDTIADVLKYIKARAKVLEDGEWIYVSQVFITRLKEQRFPTRRELDDVAPKNPVMFRTGPDAALNSLALKLSGIDKDFKITDGKPGKIERDPRTGEPTGILRSCTRLAKRTTPKSQKKARQADRLKRLKSLLTAYNAVGITSISDRSASDSAVALYESLLKDNKLTCRVFLYYSVNAQASMRAIEQRVANAVKNPLHKYNNMLWLRGVKIFLDGGMLTGSAYMQKPWGVSRIYSISDPKYRGVLFVQPEKLYRISKVVLENNLQMTAHSVGDGAVHDLIDAYERVNKDFPIGKLRPCITHCNFMSKEAIAKMRALGIVADLQPAWLYLDGATLKKQFGLERLRYFQPYRSIAKAGVIVGGGSDHMQKLGSMRSVNPYNPFWGMWITLTRQPRRANGPLHASEKLTRRQALQLYTINNAYLTFEEKKKGSLERGKLADFVVLDRDYLTCPLEQVKTIQVLATYVGGRRVYFRREPQSPQP